MHMLYHPLSKHYLPQTSFTGFNNESPFIKNCKDLFNVVFIVDHLDTMLWKASLAVTVSSIMWPVQPGMPSKIWVSKGLFDLIYPSICNWLLFGDIFNLNVVLCENLHLHILLVEYWLWIGMFIMVRELSTCSMMTQGIVLSQLKETFLKVCKRFKSESEIKLLFQGPVFFNSPLWTWRVLALSEKRESHFYRWRQRKGIQYKCTGESGIPF